MAIVRNKKTGMLIVDGEKYMKVERALTILRKSRETEKENIELKAKVKRLVHEVIRESTNFEQGMLASKGEIPWLG